MPEPSPIHVLIDLTRNLLQLFGSLVSGLEYL